MRGINEKDYVICYDFVFFFLADDGIRFSSTSGGVGDVYKSPAYVLCVCCVCAVYVLCMRCVCVVYVLCMCCVCVVYALGLGCVCFGFVYLYVFAVCCLLYVSGAAAVIQRVAIVGWVSITTTIKTSMPHTHLTAV